MRPAAEQKGKAKRAKNFFALFVCPCRGREQGHSVFFFCILQKHTTTAMSADVSSKITNSAYGMQCLRRAAHNQLYVFANSGAIQMEIQWNYGWIAIPIALNVLMAAGIVCSAVFLIYPAFFKKKSGKTDAKKEA